MNAKNKAIITVVTVVYNAVSDLEDTILSIIRQTSFEYIEFVVIDGLSNDGTLDIINKYKEYIDIFISEKDNGVYDAMNKAIDLVNGEWINFMNAGDCFYNTLVLEKTIKNFNGTSDLAYGDVEIFDENIKRIVKADFKNKILKETPFCHQSLFVKTSLMKTMLFNTNYHVLADYDFILNCHHLGKNFQYLKFPISRYKLGGMSKKNIMLMNIEGVKILLDAQKQNHEINISQSPFYTALRYDFRDNEKKAQENICDQHIIDTYDAAEELLTTVSFFKHPIQKLKKYKKLGRVLAGESVFESLEKPIHYDNSKVLHLSTFDTLGGAARAAYRLNEALNRSNFSSMMLVLFKYGRDNTVVGIKKNRLLNYFLMKFNKYILFRYKLQELDSNRPFSTNIFGYSVIDNEVLLNASILHFHWLNYNFISLSQLGLLAQLQKPVLWTMHDMWAFTGGCHNPLGCNNFENDCGQCKLLGSKNHNDISHYVLEKKKSVLNQCDLTLIAPSQWMKEQVQNSSLFANSKVVVIPNTIDTDFFKPVIFERSKQYFPFASSDKIYIAFGSFSNAEYKGLSFLIEALNLLSLDRELKDIELILFGSHCELIVESLSPKYAYHVIGKINDDKKLRALYSLVDIFVSPSLQESFGQVLVEAMACETACVAFDYSGSKDIIEHKNNGYLSQYKSSESLKDGIDYLLNIECLDDFKTYARSSVIARFSYAVVSEKYIGLYNDLLKNKK